MTSMMRRGVLAAAALSLLSGAGWARAQGDVMGPFKFSLGAKVEYTDNRDAAPKGAEISNTDFFLVPRLDLLLQGESDLLDAHYSPIYRRRQHPNAYQDKDELFHELGLFLQSALTPNLTVRGDEQFSYTDDPRGLEGDSQTQRDAAFMVNELEIGGRMQLTQVAGLDLSGRNRIKRYDDDDFKALDETSLGARGMLIHRASPTRNLFGEAAFEDFTYENRTTDDPSFQRLSGGVGMESRITGTLRASVRGGVSRMTFDADGMDSEVYPYAIMTARLVGSPTLRFSAGASHMMRDSDVFPFAWQKATELSAGVECDTGEALTVGLDGGYRVGEYETDGRPAGSLAPVGDEKALTGRAKATLKVGPNAAVELAQQIEDVDSDVSRAYRRNATILGVKATF